MNILIITPFYKQDRNIGSVRWTNIAARLAKKHKIIVVSQPLDNDMDMTVSKTMEDGVLVARINQKTTYEKIAVKYFHGATGDDWQTTGVNSSVNTLRQETFTRKVKNRLLYASMQAKAKAYARQICREVIPKDMKIDVVISSACPFIEMLFGHEVKKLLGCKWISDFRDLPFSSIETDDKRRMKRMMVNCLKQADKVVVIAEKGKSFLVEQGIVADSEKIHVITNGFSMSDARESQTIYDRRLHLVYTGSLYGGIRKPDLLFEAVREARKLDVNFDYVLVCAGGNNSTMFDSAKKYEEEQYFIDRGFIPRSDALDLQASADCLLSLVLDHPGSLVAKLFEYMLNQKPVINITCGDHADSEENQFVKELHLGIAVAEKNGRKDVLRLADYLVMQWQRKCAGEALYYEPDFEKIKQFDHDVIAERFEKIF